VSDSKAASYDLMNLRNTLTRTACLILLTLLSVGLVSVFSIWSINRQHTMLQDRMVRILQLTDDARAAEVLHKLQIQEWKNILLRGADLKDRSRFFESFNNLGLQLEVRLADLHRGADNLKMDTLVVKVDEVSSRYARAHNAYLAALASGGREDAVASQASSGSNDIRTRRDQILLGLNTLFNPPQIDRAVRGIDRDISTAFDDIADEIMLLAKGYLIEAQHNDRVRYEQLVRVMWGALAVSIAMIGYLLWQVVRGQGQRS